MIKTKFHIIKLTGSWIGSFLVALALLELILMICGPRFYKFNDRSAEYYTNSRGYYYPIKKDGADVIYGLNYKSDRNGYRLPDEEGQYSNVGKKSENNILILGDSFTYGRGVKYKDLYATRLETLLDHHGFAAIVKNCGVMGLNLGGIYKIYEKEARLKNFPLVIYGFVLNDFKLSRSEKIVGYDFIDTNNGGYQFDPLRKSWRFYNLVCYLSDRKRLHDTTLKHYIDAFRGEDAKRNFAILKALHQAVKKNNAQLIVMVFPLLYHFDDYPFREIHEKLTSFCKKEDITMLDLFPAFSKFKAEDLWANPTDQHPNEIAHKIAAEEIYKVLVQNALLKNGKV